MAIDLLDEIKNSPAQPGKPYWNGTNWLDANGSVIENDKALAFYVSERNVFSARVDFDPAPKTRLLERLEAGITTPQDRQDAVLGALSNLEHQLRQQTKPHVMPSDVYAAMALGEYYYDTEGDLAQTIVAPSELAFKNLILSSPDSKVQEEARKIAANIALEEIVGEIYECMEIYGQAYPLEQWDANTLKAIHLINPKTVWVAQDVLGTTNSDLAKTMAGWSAPDMTTNPVNADPNETRVNKPFPIDKRIVRPLYVRKRSWQYYAMPPLRRCFRSLGTRQLLDEMTRATIEGFRNQLWVFTIGDKDHPALPNHINYLKNQIEAGSGERTGHLVWDYTLRVEQHTPKPLDTLLGNEKYVDMTVKMLSERGISLRIISGNSPMAGDRNIEIDVQILLERLKSRQAYVLRWVDYLMTKLATRLGWSAPVQAKFADTNLEDQLKIKLKIQPMYEIGLLSAATALEEAGYNYDTEKANKEKEPRDLFSPPTTFKQEVVSPDGSTKAVSSGRNGGRPQGATDKKPRDPVIKASFQYDTEWGSLIPIMWAKLVDEEITAEEFISWMAEQNLTYAPQAYGQGYLDAGGNMEMDQERLRMAVNFNAQYLTKLEEDIQASDDLTKLEWRPPEYNRNGRRIPYMYGVFQAMKEHGAKGWRRILHPERSKAGPCQWCINDSQIVHSIEEEFTDHPHGVCDVDTDVAFYRDTVVEIPIVFPVPRRREDESRYIRRNRVNAEAA